MSAGCALGMNSFIATSINLFPEVALELVTAGVNGNNLKARNLQEKLSNAVIAISKYGKNNSVHQDNFNIDLDRYHHY